MLASRVSHSRTQLARAGVGAEVQLAGVLDDDDAGVDGSTLVIARTSVVLPAPVSPEMTMRIPAPIADASSERIARSMVPRSSSSSSDGVGQHVAADRHLRHGRDVHHRGQAGAVGQAQHEQRLGVVEAALRAAGAAGEVGDLGAEVVGVGEDAVRVALGAPSTCCSQIASWALTMMSVTPSRSSSTWNLPAWK